MAPSYPNVVRAVRACGLDLAVRIVEHDEQLEALVDAHLDMTVAERHAQNQYLVDLFDRARQGPETR